MMNRKISAWLIPALLAGMVSSAYAAKATMQVSTEYDRFATFASLKTYAWHPSAAEGETSLQPEVAAMLRATVEAELQKKGMTKDTSGKPSIYVFYRINMEDRVEKTYVSRGRGEFDSNERKYLGGTMLLDLSNPNDNNRTLWRGWIQAELYPKNSPEDRRERAEKAIRKLLAEFPPK